jgi:hypothetical protein
MGWDCYIEEEQYRNGRIALQLLSARTVAEDELFRGEPIATATVNLPDEPLPEGQVFIKDWAENEGIYAALVEVGIVGPVLEKVPTGYVHAYRVELLI